MEENKIQKPFILEIDEAKSEIAQVINNAIRTRGLPLYVIDMILSEIYLQVKDGAKGELAMAREQMIKSSETAE